MTRLHARHGQPRHHETGLQSHPVQFNPWALLGVICAIVAAAAYVSGAMG